MATCLSIEIDLSNGLASIGSGRKLCIMTLNEQLHFHLLTETVTRFPILSIDTMGYYLAVADQKEGLLIYTYQPDQNQMSLLCAGGTIRLSSDLLFLNPNLCVATDKTGNVFGIACDSWAREGDELVRSVPETMYFHLGEVALRLQRGSLVMSSPVERTPSHLESFIIMTLLGSVFVFHAMEEKDHYLARLLQTTLYEDASLEPLLMSYSWCEYRYQGLGGEHEVIDGDFITQFLTLSQPIQERIVERLRLGYLEKGGCSITAETFSVDALCHFITTLNQQCI
jgi:hypothetical protein